MIDKKLLNALGKIIHDSSCIMHTSWENRDEWVVDMYEGVAKHLIQLEEWRKNPKHFETLTHAHVNNKHFLHHFKNGEKFLGPHEKLVFTENEPSYSYGYAIFGNCSNITGDASGIRGNVSYIHGDVTGLYGYITGFSGNLDEYEFSDEDRKNGIKIS